MLNTVMLPYDHAASRLGRRKLPTRIALLAVGTLVLAVSSYISVPMIPVPMTLQTLAVTLIGAAYGWRLGALTVMVWLAEALVGFPVLQGGASGPLVFLGPTAGYLFSFPLVAAVVGVLAKRGWNGRRPGWAFVAMLIGNMLCLFLGAAWLATPIGLAPAVALGVVPFLIGGLMKSMLGAALLRAFSRRA